MKFVKLTTKVKLFWPLPGRTDTKAEGWENCHTSIQTATVTTLARLQVVNVILFFILID